MARGCRPGVWSLERLNACIFLDGGTSGCAPLSCVPLTPESVALLVDYQQLGGTELITQASPAHRALGAQDHAHPARVGHPQGALGGSVSHRPVPLDPVQADDDDALAIQHLTQAAPDAAQAWLRHLGSPALLVERN